jgi:ABC-type sugar transport system permease subunit
MTLGSWKGVPVKDVSPTQAIAGAQLSEAEVAVRTGRHGRRTNRLTPYLFLLIPILLLIVFTYIPIANMISYSFVKWDGLSPVKRFIGLDNYVEVFTRPELFGVFIVSVFYIVGAFAQMAVALYLATMLSFKVRFRTLFKGIIFFPYLINGVAISFIFLYVFRPDGVLDSLLGVAGVIETPLWLGDRDYVNYSLASVSVWRYMGLNFVLFLGAIQSIPSETMESAEIDGASRWQLFRYLIVPGIRPVIGLSFILAIAGSLSVFEIPYVMLRGANGSATFVIQTVQTAFQHQKFGLASAMAVVLLVLILVVTWIQRRVVRDERAELI